MGFRGVFTTSPFETLICSKNVVGHQGLHSNLNSVNPTTNAWAQFESNQVSLEEFDELFAKERIGWTEIRVEVISMLSGDLRPKMVELLSCARSNIKSHASQIM